MYKPYTKQREFHNAGKTKRERLLRAGNQQGKCVSYQTLIQLDTGEKRQIGLIFSEGRSVHVKSWNGNDIVRAKVTHAVRKPAEQCYRLWFSNGEWIEAAANHRMMLKSGSYDFVGALLSFVPNLPASNSELGLLTHVSDVQRWLKRQRDFPDDYQEGCRLYDAPLPFSVENVLVSPPLSSDVVQYNCALCGLDELNCKHTHSRLLSSVHLSSLDVGLQIEDQIVEFSNQDVCSYALHRKHYTLGFQQPSIELNDQSQLVYEANHDPLYFPANDGNQLIACQPVGSKAIYDLTVPEYENYYTAGCVHHNTFAAAAEAAIHSTGLYPEWWQGRVFEKETLGWAAGVTGEVTRDTIQKLLIGSNDEIGTGLIPKKNIIDIIPSRGVAGLADTILVRNVLSGEASTIKLKYFEQGREKFQSATINWGWPDEECPSDIYSEFLTRTNATGGMLFMTFTPLLGMTEVVRRFMMEPSEDRVDINMTIMDAEHISPEQRQIIINSYPAHEREARINGTPILGSGRIFPIAEDEVMCDPIPPNDIPSHWRVLGALDFGWDHPTAAVKLLHDPDDDIIYITNVYKAKEKTPIMHAAALRPWGKDLHFAWPHDGLQHDKGSGEQLKKLYEDEGLNMLAERAKFEDDRGNGVEAGLAEMLMRMETGRLKVYKHLSDWFEEFRLYHRKEGRVVKEFDDLMSASRYGMMCIGFAAPIEGYASLTRIKSGSWMSA